MQNSQARFCKILDGKARKYKILQTLAFLQMCLAISYSDLQVFLQEIKMVLYLARGLPEAVLQVYNYIRLYNIIYK